MSVAAVDPPDVLSAHRGVVVVEDCEVAFLRFGRRGAPPMIFAHANGFCASAYRQMLNFIKDGFDIFAIDQRGHGRTRLPADPKRRSDMSLFGDDLLRIMENIAARFDIAGEWTLAGHSMGGVACVFAASKSGRVSAVRLIEPVVVPDRYRLLARLPGYRSQARKSPLVRAALSRRSRWPGREAVLDSYRTKALFSTWRAGVLEDYLTDGLKHDDDGVRLACAPEWEASNFMAFGHDFWGALKKIRAPVAVLGARHASSTLMGDAADRFRRAGAQVIRADGVTHLIPFEKPDLAARFLLGEPV
ncbi:MAG: alpha/beta hydrolase [Parvularculaceae bacterium]|nr:alpha/beta hydrolase [Parvularculaceae bacterium]